MLSNFSFHLMELRSLGKRFRIPSWCQTELMDGVVLALVPLLILLRNPGALVSPLGIDAWMYFGYYLSLPEYLQTFDGYYYTTRLSVIVPGWLAYRVFPPLAANFVLHIGLYSVSVGSLYLTLRDTVDRRVALLCALGLATNSGFLFSIGWDYVDGFGIAYFLLTVWLLTAATRGRHRTNLLAAGAAAAALGIANLTYFILMPFLVAHFFLLNSQRARVSRLAAGSWFTLGAGGFFILLGSCNYLAAGRFWFLLPSVQWTWGFVREPGPNPWQMPLSEWWMAAVWLVLPIVATIGSLLYLALLHRMSVECRRSPGAYYQLQLLALFGTFAVVSLFGRTCLLQFAHYASLLLPAVFLALGGQAEQFLLRLDGRSFRALSVVASTILICSLVPPPLLSYSRMMLGNLQLLPALLAGVAAVALLQLAPARLVVGLIALPLLAMSQLLARSDDGLANSLRNALPGTSPEPELTDRVLGFQLVAETTRHIRSVDATGNTWFWYSSHDPRYKLFTMIASTHGYMSRLLNTVFPALPDSVTLGGTSLHPHMRLAVLSSEPDAFDAARQALLSHRLDARLLHHAAIAEDGVAFHLFVIELQHPVATNCEGGTP